MQLKKIHDDLALRIKKHREALEEMIDDYISDMDTEDAIIKGDAKEVLRLQGVMQDFFDRHTIPFLAFLALSIRKVLKVSQNNFNGNFSDVAHLEKALGIKNGKIVRAIDGKVTVLYAIGEMKVLENDMVLFVNNALNGEVLRRDLKKNLHRIISRKYHDFVEIYAIGALMQTYNAAQYTFAKKGGYDKFVYEGGLIEESRDFCVERDGQEFWDYQGEEWDKIWWKGKIEGVPFFIQVGGYNCRHHLEWFKSDDKEA